MAAGNASRPSTRARSETRPYSDWASTSCLAKARAPRRHIQVEKRVLSITPSQSRPEYGAVRSKITVPNQLGEIVYTMIPKLWAPRRPAKHCCNPSA
jgi:hypothetical protein